MLYRKRKIPIRYIQPSLQTAVTTVARATIEIAIATTETTVTIEYTSNRTADLKDIAISVRRKTADYRSIYIKSIQKPRNYTRTSLTTISRNVSSSILSTAKKIKIAKTQKT